MEAFKFSEDGNTGIWRYNHTNVLGENGFVDKKLCEEMFNGLGLETKLLEREESISLAAIHLKPTVGIEIKKFFGLGKSSIVSYSTDSKFNKKLFEEIKKRIAFHSISPSRNFINGVAEEVRASMQVYSILLDVTPRENYSNQQIWDCSIYSAFLYSFFKLSNEEIIDRVKRDLGISLKK